MTAPWFLSPSNLLGMISPADRDALAALSQRHSCKRHEFVFRVGAPADHMYVLREGRVKIFGLSGTGKETILWFCFPGEMFGLAEITRGHQREVYAQACTDCEYDSIPQAKFKDFLANHPGTALAVLELFSCRLRVLGEMLQALTADDVTTRVVKLLLRLCARYGRPMQGGICLDIPLTHQEMADMVGATRQTVTAVLNDLKRIGALRIEHHLIWIEQAELLERMALNPAAAPVSLSA